MSIDVISGAYFNKSYLLDLVALTGLPEEFAREVTSARRLFKIINKSDKFVVVSGILSMELSRVPYSEEMIQETTNGARITKRTAYLPVDQGMAYKLVESPRGGNNTIREYSLPHNNYIHFPTTTAIKGSEVTENLVTNLPEVAALSSDGFYRLASFGGHVALSQVADHIKAIN